MDMGQFVADFLGNDVVLVFSLAVAVVFSLSLFSPRFRGDGAALCTTIGVLGTFTGVFVGLLQFDVAMIDRSVPRLLEGLKIAFSTSIVGMGAAVLLRVLEASLPSRPDAGGEATPAAIHQTLREIDNTISRSADSQADALTGLRNAISSDGDGSLMTQTQKLRLSVEDGNRQLIAEFRQFAETMAENNSRSLVEALERVIREFNTQLNEQFGENFKQLNEAVGALLEWQERYRTHVETMEERIAMAVAALQVSEDALRRIAEHGAQITQIAEQIPGALAALQVLLNDFAATTETLQGLLAGFGAATDEMKVHLDAVASLKDRALEAFPTIEKNIAGLTEGFSAAVGDALDKQNEMQVCLPGLLGCGPGGCPNTAVGGPRRTHQYNRRLRQRDAETTPGSTASSSGKYSELRPTNATRVDQSHRSHGTATRLFV